MERLVWLWPLLGIVLHSYYSAAMKTWCGIPIWQEPTTYLMFFPAMVAGPLLHLFSRRHGGLKMGDWMIPKEAVAEIDRLRAELAFMRGHGIVQHNERLKAELAEAKARIAELEDDVAHLCGQMAGKIGEGVTKDARITEFEARLQRQYAILLEHKSRAEKAEAHIKELNDKWADDVLRVERAEAAAACYARQIGSADAENANLRDAVKRAEAELDISREAHRMVQSALLSQAAETERAEAERDALRELLEMLQSAQWLKPAQRKAIRAALAPSPAGREG